MATHIARFSEAELEIASGAGVFLRDAQGKEYLDFSAGWCVGNVGWGRKEVREALEREAKRGIYVPSSQTYREAEEYADLLIAHAPSPALQRVYRATSGSEAVEFAIKCARASTGRTLIVSITNVYHGHTYGAASLGNAATPKMQPAVPGFLKIPLPSSYHGVAGEQVIGAFADLLEKNGNDIAAFVSEPVWTNAGVILPPPEFYRAIENLCRAHDVLLVMDEVATGFGRLGTLFASEGEGIRPDILCLGKGMTGGYGSMAATLVTEEVFENSRGIPSYSTFGWNPTDLAASRSVLDVLLQEKLWENAAKVGEFLLGEFRAFPSHPAIGDIRGRGLLLGIEIVKEGTKEPDFDRAEAIRIACREAGLLIETAHNVLFITPPLILTEEEARKGAEILREVLEKLCGQ